MNTELILSMLRIRLYLSGEYKLDTPTGIEERNDLALKEVERALREAASPRTGSRQ